MSELKTEINGINIFEHDYDRWRNHEECNGLTGEGVAFRFNRFLKHYDLVLSEYETVEDTWNNLSAARDGNRYDIHDNYVFDEDNDLEISFLYVVNGNLWATLLQGNEWYGDFEIPANV